MKRLKAIFSSPKQDHCGENSPSSTPSIPSFGTNVLGRIGRLPFRGIFHGESGDPDASIPSPSVQDSKIVLAGWLRKAGGLKKTMGSHKGSHNSLQLRYFILSTDGRMSYCASGPPSTSSHAGAFTPLDEAENAVKGLEFENTWNIGGCYVRHRGPMLGHSHCFTIQGVNTKKPLKEYFLFPRTDDDAQAAQQWMTALMLISGKPYASWLRATLVGYPTEADMSRTKRRLAQSPLFEGCLASANNRYSVYLLY